MKISHKTIVEMRAEIAAGSPLLKDRLRPTGSEVPALGFSDLFTTACKGGAVPPGDDGSGIDEISGAVHYCFALEYIFEGYLLHYGQSRLLSPGSRDFNLLAGDYMYAQGLDRIARLEDPACIKMFADLVSLCSYVSCEELEPVVALRAWAATALCLAAHASGNGKPGARRLEGIKQEVWGKDSADRVQDSAKKASGAFEDLLAGYSQNARGLLRSVLSEIYSLHVL